MQWHSVAPLFKLSQSTVGPMKLTIEVIPQSLWGVNLRNELGPAAWRKVRKACFAQAGHRCEICGDVDPLGRLDCHEIWEYDDERCVQRLAGFIALCPDCHEVKHYGRTCAMGRAHRAQRHFMSVNQCTPEQMRAHIEESRLRWEQRSQRVWSQNLSWFDRFACLP